MSDIKVIIGGTTHKESVLINPNINPIQNAPSSKEAFAQMQKEQNNILAVGGNRIQALREFYGKRF